LPLLKKIIYFRAIETVRDSKNGVSNRFTFHKRERSHQALDYQPPDSAADAVFRCINNDQKEEKVQKIKIE
jgi:hypothetical protein